MNPPTSDRYYLSIIAGIRRKLSFGSTPDARVQAGQSDTGRWRVLHVQSGYRVWQTRSGAPMSRADAIRTADALSTILGRLAEAA